ncbi:MAG: hypothetical protein LBP59_04230 [Planctomycetaceae bacterium]|nr:hypothetical protein [Planctomycetaceae bacterium]
MFYAYYGVSAKHRNTFLQKNEFLEIPFNLRNYFKLFVLEFAFTFACLAFGRQALTLLNR